jgi:hypothetical protein
MIFANMQNLFTKINKKLENAKTKLEMLERFSPNFVTIIRNLAFSLK